MALIQDRADAAQRERAITMPSPERTARRGVSVGRAIGLSRNRAALMVMTAASAAAASANQDGARDTTWLIQVHAEAERIYQQTRPAGGSL